MILLGPAMGAALSLRGVPTMHAAAVAVGDMAVLFTGKAGVGKSTLTAALVAEGMPLLCDDLAPLHISDEHVLVQPGYPLLKVSPDSARFLGRSPDSLPRVFTTLPGHDERWLDVNTLRGKFCRAATPLRTIYLLEGRRADLRAPQIVELPPTTGCLALTEHLYGRAWLDIPRDKVLRVCARIAGRVPVRRVWLPEGLNTTRNSAHALINDARCLPPPSGIV